MRVLPDVHTFREFGFKISVWGLVPNMTDGNSWGTDFLQEGLQEGQQPSRKGLSCQKQRGGGGATWGKVSTAHC